MHTLHRSIIYFSSVVFAFPMTSTIFAADAPLFNRDIRPILSANCFQCHGPDDKHREADMRLDDEEGVLAAFSGSLAKSEAWQRIISDDPDTRMPPVDSHLELKPEQIALLKAWIESGAKWEGHWSFIAPQRPPVPKTNKPDWVKNAIDSFILKRLDERGLTPNNPAQLERVLRRVTFDLTGLLEAFRRADGTGVDGRRPVWRLQRLPRRRSTRHVAVA
jgi:hypothetical protein